MVSGKIDAVVGVGDSVEVRDAIYITKTRQLAHRSDIVRLSAHIWAEGPVRELLSTYHLPLESVMSDGPIFHEQDAGWPSSDIGRNFLWEIPAGVLSRDETVYTIEVVALMRGRRQATLTYRVRTRQPWVYA